MNQDINSDFDSLERVLYKLKLFFCLSDTDLFYIEVYCTTMYD